MPPARRLTGRLAALAAGVLGLTLTGFLPLPARADTVASKQAQAAQIAAKVDALNNQIEILAEQFDAATIQLQKVNHDISAAQVKVAATRAEEVTKRAQLQSFAIDAYMTGGSTDPLPVLLHSTDGNDIGQRTGYLQAAVGNRQQLIDQLRASEQDLDTQLSGLAKAQTEAKSVASTLAARRSAANKAVAQLNALLSSVKGQLATLVAQAQAAAAARAAGPPHSTGAGGSSHSGTGSGHSPVNPPPINGGAAGAVAMAKAQLGKPYVWGAAGPGSFDCSGLTYYAWRYGGGVTLPHNSGAQYSVTTHISISALQPGDLVFYGHPIHHVAIYVGNGQIIHAPHPGAVVQYASVYYWNELAGAGRVG